MQVPNVSPGSHQGHTVCPRSLPISQSLSTIHSTYGVLYVQEVIVHFLYSLYIEMDETSWAYSIITVPSLQVDTTSKYEHLQNLCLKRI